MCEELKTAKGRTGRREDYELSPSRMIHILSHVMKRSSGLPQEVEGLTPMQGHVLKYILIMTMQKELYQRDIEEEFLIRRSTATGILQLLEKNGFIRRENVSKDARLKRIVPTERAEELRPMILEKIKAQNEKLVEGIQKEQLDCCMEVLGQMLRNLLSMDDKNDTDKNSRRT